MLSQWHLVPDLKEGECCPLQETLGIANFSVEFLWGENHTHIQYITHSIYIYIVYAMSYWHCFLIIHLLLWWHIFLILSLFLRTLLTFCEAFGKTWLLAVPDWESKNPISPRCVCSTRLSSSAAPCISLLILFLYKSVTHPLSSKEGTLSWSYHKVLTVR